MNSLTTDEFWQRYNALPASVQELAVKNFQLWLIDSRHPSLHFKPFKNNSWSVRIGLSHRAVGKYVGKDNFIWYWIGTHEDYDHL